MDGIIATVQREHSVMNEPTTVEGEEEERGLSIRKRQRPKSSKGGLRRPAMCSVGAREHEECAADVVTDADDVFMTCDKATRPITKRPQSAWNSRIRRPHFSATDFDSGCEDGADGEVEVLYLDEKYALSSESSADGSKDESSTDSSVSLVSAWDDASSGTHCRRASDVLKLDVGWFNKVREKEHQQQQQLQQQQQQKSQQYPRHQQHHRRATSLKGQAGYKCSATTDEFPRRRIVSESDKARTKVSANKNVPEWKNSCNNNQQASISQLARDFACGQVAENVLTRYRRRAVSDVSQQQSLIVSLNGSQRTGLYANSDKLPHAPRKLKPLYPKTKVNDNVDAITTQMTLSLNASSKHNNATEGCKNHNKVLH